jgi:protein-disulfide isomerase
MAFRATLSASAILLVAALVVDSDRGDRVPSWLQETSADTQDLMINQRSKGSPTAPIVVFEMSDFQCPFCRQHAMSTFPELDRRYVKTGKVRWTFVNFPIPQLHANATTAAEFAMCAARLDRFWPVHDLIFKHQNSWKSLPDPAPFLITLADSAGIKRPDILPCLIQGQTRELVRTEAEEVARVGIQSTPTFVIEGKLLRGAAPLEVFVGILDSIYAAKMQPSVNPER